MGSDQVYEPSAVLGRRYTFAATPFNRVPLNVDAHASIPVASGKPLSTCTGYSPLAFECWLFQHVAFLAITATAPIKGRRIPLSLVPDSALSPKASVSMYRTQGYTKASAASPHGDVQ